METTVLLEKCSGVWLASSFVQTQLSGHQNQNNERGIRRGAKASAVFGFQINDRLTTKDNKIFEAILQHGPQQKNS